MIKQYNITDYIKDDPELQKAVIEEFLNDIKRLQTENELLKRLLNEKVKTLDKMTGIYSARLCKKYKQALEEIREIANLIVNDEDKPSCVNDDDCPLNDGDGLDNHCDMNCPYILGKHIQDKISEVLK